MGATPSMIESSLGYTKVMFAGNATVTLLFLNNAIFRGAGDPAIAMRMLWISQRDQHRRVPAVDLRRRVRFPRWA